MEAAQQPFGPSSPSQRFLETYSRPGDGESVIRSYHRTLLGTWNCLLLVDATGGRAGKSEARESKEARDKKSDRDDQQEAATTDLDAVAARAFARMARFEEELSKFLPDSEVSLMNALARERPFPASGTLFELLRLSRDAWKKTDGAFDPSVGPLLAAWGFDDRAGRVPGDEELEALRAQCGFEHVELDEASRSVTFRRPGLSLDLGAMGKGYIVDAVVDMIRESGVAAGALLSGRSTIVVWGAPPLERAWRVAVTDPRDPDTSLLELEVEAGAVSTSAAYERSFERDGVVYGHVIDPRSGRPVRSGCLSVTVWTPDAVSGDVLSTALYVRGREESEEILARFGRATALYVEEDTSVWGGVGWSVRAAGRAGFEIIS